MRPKTKEKIDIELTIQTEDKKIMNENTRQVRRLTEFRVFSFFFFLHFLAFARFLVTFLLI